MNRFLNRDWYRIVTTCNLQHWKEALIMIMTYTQNEELASLCDALGARLEGENYLMDACICYVCSSNLDNFVSCWQKLIVDLNSSTSLQVKLFELLNNDSYFFNFLLLTWRTQLRKPLCWGTHWKMFIQNWVDTWKARVHRRNWTRHLWNMPSCWPIKAAFSAHTIT